MPFEKIITHVPLGYDSQKLNEGINNFDLSINYLSEKADSFYVIGNKENIEKYKKYVHELNDPNVVILENEPSKAKSYMRGKRVVEKELLEKEIKQHGVYNPYFTPKDIATIYGIPSTTNRTGIAIIELGGGYNNADLQTYWNFLSLTTKPNVYALSVDGAYNLQGSDADFEVVLDIEVVGGICPNSNIYVYFAPNTDKGFYDAIYSAIYSTKYPVSIISISWGSPENEWPSSTLNAFNSLFMAAAQKGITICVASGDNGSSDGEIGTTNVDFPASSPWVLACGGTSLVCPTNIYNNLTTKEIAWGNIGPSYGSGGGFSKIFPKPAYQIVTTTNFNKTHRGVPDVCGNADPKTGWIIYLHGNYYTIGGTSAVAPMWAALLGACNFNKFLNPVLYSLYNVNQRIVHDILIGNNGVYTTTTGWDPVTGLGSPAGMFLIPLLK